MDVYLCGDTGPSGFGVATREVLKHLVESDEFNVTAKTHFWGLNKEGIHFHDGGFPDTRMQEWLYREDYINDDYLITDPREMADRRNVDLMQDLGTAETTPSEECIVKQFDGREDVWLTIGGPGFAEQAPKNPHIYTILSTDYNLDIVPRDWEYYLNQVDETWVPSGWTRDAIENRSPDLADDVHAMPYGINMRYEPTEYDCDVCPHNTAQQQAGPPQQCARRGATTFLMVSRFYHIKGIYRTIKAYIEEFRQNDDVQLILKTTSNNQFEFNPVAAIQGIIDELGYPDNPEMGPVMKPMETQYLYDLMGHADAFIQASRAECFGIAQLQAAYCGTPVIYTNWSAQAELLPELGGFLPIDDYEVERPRQEYRGLPFEVSDSYPPDSNWAVPSIEAIRERMREIHEMKREDREQIGQQARRHVKQHFKWADAMEPRFERLREASHV